MSEEETYVVRIEVRGGERKATRKPCVVPLAIATGDYELLSDRALRDHLKDVTHEFVRRRRGESCPDVPWDPEATQIRAMIDIEDAL